MSGVIEVQQLVPVRPDYFKRLTTTKAFSVRLQSSNLINYQGVRTLFVGRLATFCCFVFTTLAMLEVWIETRRMTWKFGENPENDPLENVFNF